MTLNRLLAGAAGTLALVAAPLAAQGVGARPAAPTVEIVPYAGYMLSGSLLDGPLGTSIQSAGGPLYGAQLGIPITSNVALVGNVAFSRSDLQVGLPILGGYSVGQSQRVLYDGGLQISAPVRTPSGKSLVPFVQAGVGAMRTDVTVASVSTHGTSFAANAGAGVDVALGPNFGLRLLARDYFSKFDSQQAVALNLDTKTQQNWALTGGLKIGF